MARVAALLFFFLGVVCTFSVCASEKAPDTLDETISTAFMADMVQTVFFEESAIPVSQANMVTQTRDGYVWIAGYDGLIRFDGKHSRVFGSDDGLGSDSITFLYEDSRGRLWIASNNAGLFLLENGKEFRPFNQESGLASNTVRDIAEDSDGNIYAATSRGVSRIAPDFSITQIRRGRSRSPIPSGKIMVDKNDNIWCIRDVNHIVVMKRAGNTLREISSADFGGLEFNSLFQDSSGRVCIGTAENKIITYKTPESTYWRILGTGTRNNINSLYEDDAGRLWICSDTGMGFFVADTFHPVDGALVDNSLENMFQDYEGGYWFASSRKGVLHTSKSKFRDVSLANRLPELTVNSTLYYRGKLYIAADEGLIVLRADGSRVHNDLTEKLAGVRIRCLVADARDNVWICTYARYGVVRYREDGVFVSITEKEGLPHNRVRCAIPLADGSLAVGTNGGVAIIRDDEVVRTVGAADGMRNTVVLSLCEEKDGTLYAGTDGTGIYRIVPGGVAQNITAADGLGADIILRMTADPHRGGIWISTGNALSRLVDGVVQPLDNLRAFASSVFDIKFGRNGMIWLLGSRGVCVVDGEAALDGKTPAAETFSRRDGLTSTVTANSWSHLIEDGRLFIACNRGVIVADTDQVKRNQVRPKLAVNRVVIDDEVHERPTSLSIPPGARRVTIDFAVLSYAYTSGNEVKAFLKGFDEEPAVLSTDLTTQASYTNLPGGKYEFRITGKNKEGMESEPLILPIFKELRPLEQPAVKAALGAGAFLLALTLAWLYFRHKTRALVKRQGEYRSITEQAISAIADTIDAKDEYTAGHSKRVAGYSREIASRMGIEGEELENLYYTALLHDIGKIGLEDNILKKRGGLTDGEYAKMKRHPTIGGDILKSITVVNNIAHGARFHHERFDGKGYPSGLKGDEIPLFARIICIADAFDAMSTNRPYRNSLNSEHILEELERCSGQQFDRDIVPYMVEVAKRVFADGGRVG